MADKTIRPTAGQAAHPGDLNPGHAGPCRHIDTLGRLAPIPPDHVEVP